MNMFYSPFIIPIVAIVGAFTFTIVQTLARARVRELEIKERIAMIEKGLVPPPEKDPEGFDRAIGLLHHRDRVGPFHVRRAGGRHRRAGITLIGVGLGLMVLIRYAGQAPGPAVGVGGFLVILGLAFVINGLFERDEPATSVPSSTPTNQFPPASGS